MAFFASGTFLEAAFPGEVFAVLAAADGFFAGAFLAGAFFAGAFFAGAFFVVAFIVGVFFAVVLAGVFLAGAFLAAVWAGAFFAVALAVVAFFTFWGAVFLLVVALAAVFRVEAAVLFFTGDFFVVLATADFPGFRGDVVAAFLARCFGAVSCFFFVAMAIPRGRYVVVMSAFHRRE